MSKKRYIKPEQVKKLEIDVNNFLQRYYPEQNPKKFRDDTEAGLIKCIKAFVFLQGGQSERVDNRGYWLENEKKYVPSMCEKGTADIHCTIKGKSVKVEIKIGSDRQSEAQKRYQKRVERAGGIYFITRGLSEFVEQYKSIT